MSTYVSREKPYTHKQVHAYMNSSRYLEQWFEFLFPPPSSLKSIFEKHGRECESHDDNFEA